MTRRSWPLAAVIFALLSCGGLESRSYTYQPVAKGKAGPALYVGATRTLKNGWSEELRFDAPYRVSVSVDAPEKSPKPFQVRSLTFEHEGKTVVAQNSSDEPLDATVADPKANRNQMVVWVPLDGLTFVEGSTLSIKAEVRLPGSSEWVVVQQTYAATKDEKSYSGCERFAMH